MKKIKKFRENHQKNNNTYNNLMKMMRLALNRKLK